MNEQNNTPALRVSAPITIDGFEPQTWREATELATALSKSAIIPRALQGRPSDVLVILMNGRELGLGPMQALRQIYVVDGKPSLSAALKIGLCMKSPVCEYFTLKDSTSTSCTYETKRRGAVEPTHLTFTMEDAKRAGVAGKDNWTKYPAAMLRARCGSALAETVYPDVVGNLYDPDEIAPEGPAPRRRANVPKVQDEIIDAPAPVAEPAATAPAEPPPEVEILAGGTPPPRSEHGAILDEMVRGSEKPAATKPIPPEAPRTATPAPAPAPLPASNGELKSMSGLTQNEWTLLTEEARAQRKDITRKQCKLILDLAKSKGINDHKLVVNALRDDFSQEFTEFDVKELWQINGSIASYAIEALKPS